MNSCLIFGVAHAGNHLIIRLMDLIGLAQYHHIAKEGNERLFTIPQQGYQQFMFCLHYQEKWETMFNSCGIHGIYIIRDPRDVAISIARTYAYDNDSNFDNELFRQLSTIADRFELQDGWRFNDNIYTTTFENLVGDYGGGNKISQSNEILNMCSHLDYNCDKVKLEYIQDNLYNNRSFHLERIPADYPTKFLGGKIGNWKRLFNSKHNELWASQLDGSKCLQEIMNLLKDDHDR